MRRSVREPVRIDLRDEHLRIRLVGEDGRPFSLDWPSGPTLVPLDVSGAGAEPLHGDPGKEGSFFPSVAPGRWRLLVHRMKPVAPDRAVAEVAYETEVDLAAGVHEKTVTVPAR